MLESEAEGTVTPEAAVVSQLLHSNRLVGSVSFVVESHKVVDAEVVDIIIVSFATTGEILAEIGAVGTNNLGQLVKGQIVL